MAMDNATLNGLARSGRDVRLYSSLDEPRTAEKLARHPSFTVVSDQIKARAGETLLETAISLQKAGLHTPAQQAIHLALPVLESKNLAFSMVDLLTEAKSFAAEGTGFTELGGEINAQIKRGDWHCCKVSDEAAFCLIQRPYISKTLLTRRISPRGSP
ncbi:hypothetical protein ECZU23_51740 [Escherichia coli]|nr:hypothetical protein ECZU23_51740 [Escherichia coli]